MSNLSNTYKSGDFKNEKHVPAIIAPTEVAAGELVEVKVSIGEDIAHPNTFDHYISWVKVYFQPEGTPAPVEIGTYDFAAHGESDLFTEPVVLTHFKTDKPGTIYASSYCNIHGLWESKQEIKIK